MNTEIKNYSKEFSSSKLSEYHARVQEITDIRNRLAACEKDLQDRAYNALLFLNATDAPDGHGESVCFRPIDQITSVVLSGGLLRVNVSDGYGSVDEYFVPLALVLANDLGTQYMAYENNKQAIREESERREALIKRESRRALYEQLKKEFEGSGFPDKDW